MVQIIDAEKIKRKAIVRFIVHLIVVSLLAIGVVLGSVFSLIYSSLDYQLNLILNIVIDSLFFSFLVFYFFTIFPVVSYYFRTFRRINKTSYEHRRNVEYLEERDPKGISNVSFRTLLFSYKEGENTYKENLYVLDSDVAFKEGVHYSMYTYHNIIVSFEEIKDATVK